MDTGRETLAQNVPQPLAAGFQIQREFGSTTHPTSTEQESNLTNRPSSVADLHTRRESNLMIRPGSVDSQIQRQSNINLEEARPGLAFIKRPARSNWQSSYHKAKSLKAHERAELQVIPEPPPKRPLRLLASRMLANHSRLQSENPVPHTLSPAIGGELQVDAPPGGTPPQSSTDGVPVETLKDVGINLNVPSTVDDTPTMHDNAAMVAPDSGGQSFEDPERCNAGAQMPKLGVPYAGDQTSVSRLSQCTGSSDPRSAGKMPPYGGGDTRTATSLVANQSASIMPGNSGPNEHVSIQPASFTPGSGGFGATLHTSPFAHQPYHPTQHPPPSSAPKINMPTPVPAQAVDNLNRFHQYQYPQATAQQRLSAPAYQLKSISDDVQMRDTYHQTLQEDTEMAEGGVDGVYSSVVHQRSQTHSQPQFIDTAYQNIPPPMFHGIGQRGPPFVPFPGAQPTRLGLQSVPSSNRIDGTPGWAGRASHHQSTIPGMAYPGSQLIPSQQNVHRADPFGRGASQYQYRVQETANPGSPSVPSGSQQGTHHTDHFGGGSASQYQSRVPETANPGSQTVPSGSQQATTLPDAASAQAINLFTQRMSELITTVNTTNSRHQEDMKRVFGELRSQREGMTNRNTGNATQQIPPSNTPAKSSNDARKSRRPRRKRQDPYRNEPTHLRFRQCIEKHLLYMLKIKDYSCIDQLPPPLSDEEILAFKRSDPDCITITSAEFRIDLSRSRDHPFNVEAIRVFAESFKQKVITAKWYSFPTSPPRKYLKLEYIELCLFLHLHHVKEVYRNSKKSFAEQQNRLKNAARSMRKTRLFQSRLDCVADDDELVVHNDLIQLLTSAAMSSDESDTEDPSPRKSFRIIAPAWRSQELSDFLHSIDDTILANRAPRVGHRAIRGAEPRWRKHSALVNEASVAPPQLPYNCYDSDWLASLRRGERKLLQAQETKIYDFLTGAIEYLSEHSCEDVDGSDVDRGSTSGMEDELSEN